MVIWLIGMAGSGKTTVGRQLFTLIREDYPNTVYIDGDDIREIFKNNQTPKDYSAIARRANADRISMMCQWLDKQGHNVICSILSVFEDSREWNRRNYSNYYEVYIKTSMKILFERDQKGLYSGAKSGEIPNVVGFDIPFEEPAKPNFILTNDQFKSDHSQDVKLLYNKIRFHLKYTS